MNRPKSSLAALLLAIVAAAPAVAEQASFTPAAAVAEDEDRAARLDASEAGEEQAVCREAERGEGGECRERGHADRRTRVSGLR